MPDDGALSSAIRRSAVDLPQPDGPSSEMNSPLRTARSSGPSAMTPLSYAFVTPRRLTARAVSPASTPDELLTDDMDLALRLARAQLDADALVDEAQRIGLAEVEIRLHDAGLHHLVEEGRVALVAHRADAVLQGLAGIDDAVFLHLGDGIGEQIVGHLRIELLDHGVAGG